MSHDRSDESFAAKARWFQPLTLEDRTRMLCEFTDLALENNGRAGEIGRPQRSTGRVQVLSLEDPAA